MSYAIVYSSVTGNTALLAQAIRETLPWETCCYFGAPDPQALSAERIYVGFWTDRGTCDAATAQFLRQLTRQEVFLFGTAGFGGDSAYFQRILERAEENLGPEVRVVGTYMCQGKMPPAVRRRYQAMENGTRKTAMLQNFDRAASHPDQEDLARLQAALAE